MSTSAQYILQQCKPIHTRPSLRQAEQLALYLDMLLKWNRRYNLIGTKDKTSTFQQLFADSLFLSDILHSMDLPITKALDIGAGAGIPGIPLRILWTDGHYLMLEPRQKRIAFIRYCLARLNLKGTAALDLRLKDLRPQGQGYNLILSRALCSWDSFLKQTYHLIDKDNGLGLIFSNRPWSGNSPLCPSEWRLASEKTYTLSNNVQRYFWFFRPRN